MKKKDILLGIGIVVLTAALLYISGIGCPILRYTGIPCLGCGMTRACICLVQGKWEEAFYYHPMVYLMPFCVAVLFRMEKFSKKQIKCMTAVVIFLFAVTYMYRLLDPGNEIVKWKIR